MVPVYPGQENALKIVRFSVANASRSRLGVVTPAGVIDLSAAWRDHQGVETDPGAAAPPDSVAALLDGGEGALARARLVSDWASTEGRPRPGVTWPMDKVRLLAPLERPPKIVCIGMNYRDHCRELGQDLPATPIVFAKFGTAVIGPDEPIIRPRITRKLDYEAELGVVIGKGGRHIPEHRALDHVAGYLDFNDVSARDLQFGDGQWVRGKTCDTFAPMGPALVTRDEIPDPQNLAVLCRVNGKTVQQSNTGQMIFSVAFIVAFLSEFMTLEVGDVIATGTPPGVGVFRKPPVFLQPGDVVEIEIEGLGTLRNPVRDEE